MPCSAHEPVDSEGRRPKRSSKPSTSIFWNPAERAPLEPIELLRLIVSALAGKDLPCWEP